jgi:hypothetical protein
MVNLPLVLTVDKDNHSSMVDEGMAPHGLFKTINMLRAFLGREVKGPSNRDRVLCL